jgi:hypothetical protein
MPKGERVLAQSKKTTPPIFEKNDLCLSYQIGILWWKFLIDIFQNWYTFQLVRIFQIGIFFQLVKPFWTLRGEFYPGGVFVLVKEKAFETGGENFKSWKCFSKSYLYTFDYLQKTLKKNFQKDLQKQNKWCKCGPKCQKKEGNPWIFSESINWFNSKQSLHLPYAN